MTDKPIPTTSASDELDAKIDTMLMWNIQGHTEPVVFQPEMKKAIKKLAREYALHVVKEAVGPEVKPLVPDRHTISDAMNAQRADTLSRAEKIVGGE